MGGSRTTIVLVGAAVITFGSVALADPVGESSFVPIGLSTGGKTVSSVVVEEGDHLWKISQTHLDQVLGKQATAGEVDPYWRSVIEANRKRLVSGDPNLIFPGEVVVLPPTG
jgi:nucleoid-associated protein YgaU